MYIERNYFIATIVAILVIILLLGSFLSDQCTDIGEEKACWKTVEITLVSDLCPDPQVPCTASPTDQQYNAIVDALLRACETTKSNGYRNAQLNARIEEITEAFTNYKMTVQELCNQPAYILTKRRYGSMQLP